MYREPTVTGRKPGLKSTVWSRRKKDTFSQNRMKKQEFQKMLGPKKHTPRHIIITLPNITDKERILKAAREKETVAYKGVPIRLSADFSKQTLQARRGWKEVFQVMKGQDLHAFKMTLSSKAIN